MSASNFGRIPRRVLVHWAFDVTPGASYVDSSLWMSNGNSIVPMLTHHGRNMLTRKRGRGKVWVLPMVLRAAALESARLLLPELGSLGLMAACLCLVCYAWWAGYARI